MRISKPEYSRFSRWLIESTRESIPLLHKERIRDRDRQSALLFWLGAACLGLISYTFSQPSPEFSTLQGLSIVFLGLAVVAIVIFHLLRIILDRREAGQVHHCVTHLSGYLVPEDLAHPNAVEALSPEQLYDLIDEIAMGSLPEEVFEKIREIPISELRAKVKESVASIWDHDLRQARRISREVGWILQGSVGKWPGATDTQLQEMPAKALREAAKRASCTRKIERAVEWNTFVTYALFGIGFVSLLSHIIGKIY